MSLEAVTNAVVAIYLDGGELRERGLSRPLGAAAAKMLVREMLKAAGEEPWAEMEVEIFMAVGAILLMARPAKRRLCCFSFLDAETLLAAVASCPAGLPSGLTYYNGAFLLSVAGTQSALLAALFEYGDTVPDAEIYMAHLQEHGECILSANAVSELKRHFL